MWLWRWFDEYIIEDGGQYLNVLGRGYACTELILVSYGSRCYLDAVGRLGETSKCTLRDGKIYI